VLHSTLYSKAHIHNTSTTPAATVVKATSIAIPLPAFTSPAPLPLLGAAVLAAAALAELVANALVALATALAGEVADATLVALGLTTLVSTVTTPIPVGLLSAINTNDPLVVVHEDAVVPVVDSASTYTVRFVLAALAISELNSSGS